ncbi:5S rRNA maturation endonuclease (ribonuclease M5) [Actinoplanes campanulatus]|uniref:5S rRNA maturation endonuclease (Ribonuclease M5) n=1 Tax=Actinoplanes campanulatus TaxID=113559 RepID=A0A7W5ANM3_9ACTN|nr:toprim domain-containing protein [Actinoplanes campanulatus]MBB3099425.1 5S rRNA maturation endonuclease (ribonuclease M5) [Actinoplanes campanulatus]
MRPLSVSQREALEEAVSSYQAQLTADAAGYLLARGISREAAVTHRLGVVGNPLPGHNRYAGWLVIPYLDSEGQALQLRFRCMQDHDHRAGFHGKYATIKNDPVRMFNVGAIFQAESEIHVCEGELDAIILNMLGLHAVAIPGAELWRPHHRRMLAGFNRIWVWGDPDDAGADFTNKVTRSLRQAKGVRLSLGDVTDTYLQAGVDDLFALVGKEAPAPWN